MTLTGRVNVVSLDFSKGRGGIFEETWPWVNDDDGLDDLNLNKITCQ